MSISSKLEKLETDITSAYSAIDNKGGTIPQNKNTENLANAISSISDIPDGIFIQEGQPTKTTTEALWLKKNTQTQTTLLDLAPSDLIVFNNKTLGEYLANLTDSQKEMINSNTYLLIIPRYTQDMYAEFLWSFSDYIPDDVQFKMRATDEHPVARINLNGTFSTYTQHSENYHYVVTPANEDWLTPGKYWCSGNIYNGQTIFIEGSPLGNIETGLYIDVDNNRYIVHTNKSNSWNKILDTSNADAVAGNILSGKTAFVNNTKLTGSMANNGALSYTPTTSSQSIPAGYTSGGTISAVTSAIDNNIVAGNIKSGTTILGVTGNVVELNGETKTITPTTSQQVVTPSANKNAMTQVTVNAVTSSIDNNITAENIKKDVSILGVTGTYEGSGGGSILNGIIEQYKASTGTISANTFVEFINDIRVQSDSNSYEYASALLLETNKVFLTYRAANKLYAKICAINDATITIGSGIQLTSSNSTYEYNSPVLIDSNKVFISHRNSSYLYGIVCTINGMTITAGTDTQLSDVLNSYTNSKSSLLATNKVFVAHYNNNSVYGLVCTIDGTTITVGTDTQLSTMSGSYEGVSIAKLETDKVFLTHRNSNYLYGMICTIDGTTIATGTDTQLSTSYSSYVNASTIWIDTNKVFIVHSGAGALYSVVCTINGTTITVGTDKMLASNKSPLYNSPVLIETNKVFIAHIDNTTNYNLYGMICTINERAITVGSDTQLFSEKNKAKYNSAVLVDTNKVFISHSNESELNAVLIRIDGNNITKMGNIISSSSKIDGLLVTEATTSTAGDVWVLNN